MTTVPTVSFESIAMKSEHFKFDVHDLGGQTMLYHLWPHYYKNSTGVVYVRLSSSRDSFRSGVVDDPKSKRDEENASSFSSSSLQAAA